ncbi:MAG: glycosyltransferase, partial [Acidimicrobiia bacterium]|nr:glycosyltransferase [Acidimicrobiia bacterium]
MSDVAAAPLVVAVVAARNEQDTIGATAAALLGLREVGQVLVVDDGSRDDTAARALGAGATVLRLARNGGKGGAVAAALTVTPDADTYLLVDGDVGGSAAAARALLRPVLDGTADMAVGVLPAAGSRAGFGLVRDLSAFGAARATGWRPTAPLSGQRAVRAATLRAVDLAPGFGLETALNIDAVRAGARVVEVPVVMEHRHTGRGPRGAWHRARQGAAVVRALWSRLTSTTARKVLIVALTVLGLVAALWSGTRWEPTSVPATSRADKVVVFGMPQLGWEDIGHGRLPNLDRLARTGAVAAMSVRTVSHDPSVTEGYATLGAGARVSAGGAPGAAYDASAPVENGTADQALARRVGRPVDGQVVVLDGPAIVRANQGQHLTSLPGALGEALQKAHRATAAVGNADIGAAGSSQPVTSRPAAVAVMDGVSAVDTGAVEPAQVLSADPGSPFGVRSDGNKVVSETTAALARSDVVVVDTGDAERAHAASGQTLPAAAAAARQQALAHTDDVLGMVERSLPSRTLLLVVSVVPPDTTWHLTPMVAAGAGVVHGYLQSPSTGRLGLVTLTDMAPTILHSLGVPVPDGMIGQPLRYHPATVDDARLASLDRGGVTRDSIYPGIALGLVLLHAAVYLAAALLLSRRRVGRSEPFLRYGVLAIAGLPVATFLVKALPLGATPSLLAMFGVDALIVAIASRAKRRPLSALA